MAITRIDIKEASFGADIGSVDELSLNNKGIVDVGVLPSCTSLTSLNLAFNQLQNIAGLSGLTGLTSLNLAHNQIASLKGLSSLIQLRQLNVSHNKIVTLAGISGCTALVDLWAQHNQLKNVQELGALSGLQSLQRLCLAPNPVAKAIPQPQYRPLLCGSLCPQLQLLDGAAVTPADKSSPVQLSELLPGPAPQQQPPPSASSYTSQSSIAGGAQGSGIPFGQRHSAPASPIPASPPNGLPGSRGRLPVRGAAPAVRGRSGVRGGSKPPHSPIVVRKFASETGEGGEGPPGSAGGGLGGVEPGEGLGLGLGQQGPLQGPEDDLLSILSGSEAAPSIASGIGGRGRRRPGPAGPGSIPRLKEGPQTAKFQAVLANLPVIDTSKLPPKWSPTKVADAVGRKPPPPKPPPDAGVVDADIRYPTGGRGRAVTVRRDGSVHACWPSGDIAVTVDADYSTSPVSYRMLAMYRTTGNVCVSWDASGGFVQYPMGSICLSYSTATGCGSCMSRTGDTVLMKWTDPAGPPASEATQSWPGLQEGEEGGAGEGTGDGSSGAPGQQSGHGRAPGGLSISVGSGSGPEPVDVALDAHLGVRFCRRTQQLVLYVSCEGVRYRFACPPRLGVGGCYTHGPWGAPGGGGQGRRSRSVAAAAGGVEASGSGAEAEGEEGSAGSAQGRPGSPPPAFLSQLAAESGPGGVRTDVSRSMQSPKQQQQQQQQQQQAQKQEVDKEKEKEDREMDEHAQTIANVRAALKALDAGLFAGLGLGLSK